jgi:hypothetical protein
MATVVTATVGVLLLALLVAVLARHVRRFTRARADLREEVRTGVAQLRALAYVRGRRHPGGVDSGDGLGR